ncbi:subtilase family protein [Actinidia rufa]|uniref:Subtilase family protein n=1 Tax=Actinidia rufa TaxID=165716 RepID=A0A7J0GW14_9ERIC|nr:subtilase family protein [Actinidia rufa]
MNLVRDKIVLCDSWTNGRLPLVAGAAGVVMQDTSFQDYAYSFPLLATHVDVKDYVNWTSNPTATIFKSYKANETLAPFVASFSSRGPNRIKKDVLKVLEFVEKSDLQFEQRVEARPLLNPVQSFELALSFPLSVATSPEAEFAYGAGPINPLKAVNPSLVNDSESIDYVKFLCGQGYSTKSLHLITGNNSTCSGVINVTMWDLNLPSFARSPMALKSFSQTFKRTVTNVGLPSSTYKATLTTPLALKINFEPSVLSFTSLGQKLLFVVKVKGANGTTSSSFQETPPPMAGHKLPTSWLLFIGLAFSLVLSCNGASEGEKKAHTYIVYMGDRPKGDFSPSSLHTSMLQEVVGSSKASESLLHSYQKSFNGFVAKLTEEEMKKLASNKIIGAKYYRSDGRIGKGDIASPRDSHGHGTHTASTAAGWPGVSVNTFSLDQSMYPLVYGGYCFEGSLNNTLVNGTIVLCDTTSNGENQLQAGAVGTVMQDGGFTDFAFSYPLPATNLGLENSSDIYNYIKSNSEPMAIIEKSIEKKDELAPYVVSFSSRGPNPITSDILKPDLTAPGVDIVAAWSLATTVTGQEGDERVVPYNIISGTSMSCPHATGAAAYVKSFHPTWSPAAIKSALMTTASPMSVVTNTDAEFAYGAGQINPSKAANPGLVYDAGEADYVQFLCGQGYSDNSLRLITGDNTSSCIDSANATVWDLNYPSFALSSPQNKSIARVFHRTVTNVGSAVSVYMPVVVAPPGFAVSVEPSVISFKALGQKISFVVSVSGVVSERVASGSLVWDDGVYQVRSPIVAHSYS